MSETPTASPEIPAARAEVFVTPSTPPPVSPKKTQEDLNIEVYEKIFLKCMSAADRILGSRTTGSNTEQTNRVTIAVAIFDRFYNDQTAMKAGQIQAKAMIEGMTQVLEGRR